MAVGIAFPLGRNTSIEAWRSSLTNESGEVRVRPFAALSNRPGMRRAPESGRGSYVQDAPIASLRGSWMTALGTTSPERGMVEKGRQGELEDGATRRLGGRPQPPAMGLDDRTADRQAKPQAVRLRRMEGLEEVLLNCWRQPGTGIAHCD